MPGLSASSISTRRTTATETTAGGAAGYLQDTKVQQGELGTPVLQSSVQYIVHSGGGATVYPVATSTVYRNDDGTDAEKTSYTYTWFASSTQAQSMTTKLPVVSAGQNGAGTADVSTIVYNQDGRPIWMKDARGFLTYLSYDTATGALTKMIQDVDTSRTGDFTDLPGGWITPVGGGLHLIDAMQVDALGRPIETIDPNGNVTYTVYNDPNHEVRVYAGWNSTTDMPTGPTQVLRQDRPGGYTETLTMTAAPYLDLSGRPTGTEPIGNLQSLLRSYTNKAGQVMATDDYFNLTGLAWTTYPALGSEGTNFYRTSYSYDRRGRLKSTEDPLGTITRTFYNGLGYAASTWVGTNDTGWTATSAGGNMVEVSENVYDNGGVGDGNLTQVTYFPGGSAAPRLTAVLLRLARPAGGDQGRRAERRRHDDQSADHLHHARQPGRGHAGPALRRRRRHDQHGQTACRNRPRPACYSPGPTSATTTRAASLPAPPATPTARW